MAVSLNTVPNWNSNSVFGRLLPLSCRMRANEREVGCWAYLRRKQGLAGDFHSSRGGEHAGIPDADGVIAGVIP